jgi:(p)ppGpp synthase/HD superfamily hydrolase
MTERSEVEARHVKQLAVMRGWLEGRNFYRAMDALEMVRQLEQGTRKDGETPKFHHQLSIARLVSTLTPHLNDPEGTLTLAFLHDTLEDHPQITREMLSKRFGPAVGTSVWIISKKTPTLVKDKSTVFQEISEDPRASVVKLADRAHNLQTMAGVFTLEKQKAYLAEVEEEFYPLIRRARRRFPKQYPAYENLKILLRCQCRLIECIHVAAQEGIV